MSDYYANEVELHEGGKLFEQFWLRPKKYENQTAQIRLRINRKWGGWKIKDELVESLGLEVGNTISTEVTPLLTSNIIDDDNDTDLFASGEGADWLLKNGVCVGTVVDCKVRFSYFKAPFGKNGQEVYAIALVFVEGIGVVGSDSDYFKGTQDGRDELENMLRKILSNDNVDNT